MLKGGGWALLWAPWGLNLFSWNYLIKTFLEQYDFMLKSNLEQTLELSWVLWTLNIFVHHMVSDTVSVATSLSIVMLNDMLKTLYLIKRCAQPYAHKIAWSYGAQAIYNTTSAQDYDWAQNSGWVEHEQHPWAYLLDSKLY